jgi:hypothetical protein
MILISSHLQRGVGRAGGKSLPILSLAREYKEQDNKAQDLHLSLPLQWRYGEGGRRAVSNAQAYM